MTSAVPKGDGPNRAKIANIYNAKTADMGKLGVKMKKKDNSFMYGP